MIDDAIVKVRGGARPAEVAGAIAGVYRDYGQAAAQAIGAGAVNQMVKAVAVAISYLEADGLSIACVPTFVNVGDGGRDLTALRMTLVERNGSG